MAAKKGGKKKKKVTLVRLVSTGVMPNGAKSPSFYTTKKNPRMEGGYKGSGKLALMKYDKYLRKHVLHEEKKIK